MAGVPTLRPYQQDAVARIRAAFGKGKQRVVLRSEVGTGKTVIFSYIASQSKVPIMVICNRKKLVDQAYDELKGFGLNPYKLMQTGLPPAGWPLIVASVDTLRHREWPSWVRMIVIDECHLANFSKVLDLCIEKDVWVLGASATPIPNKSNKLDQYYQEMICTLPTEQHIMDGDLVLDCYYAPKAGLPDLTGIGMHKTAYGNDYNEKMLFAAYNKPKVYDDMIENWLKMCKGMRTVCFCISVEHSKNTAENFRRHGISAIHLDASSSDSERDDVQKRFEAGEYQVLCNCAIFTFGWNVKSIQCVIVNRATASYELWRQMIGRGSRPWPGKEVFWVIDQGGNYRKHGGLVDEVEWSLEPPKKKKKGALGVSPRKECPKCEALVPTTTMICPKCGHEWPAKAASLIKGAEFEVVVSKPLPTWPLATDYADVADYVRDCIRYAKQKSYNPTSVLHQIKFNSRAVAAYEQIKGYKQGWQKHQRALQ